MKSITPLFLTFLLLVSVRLAQSQEFNTDYKQALEYYNSGKFAEAGALFEKWIPKIKEEKGANDTAVYGDLVSRAWLSYLNSGNYLKAETLLKEALRIDKEVLGEDHPGYADDLSNLAVIYKKMGRYGQAVPLMKEALRIHKKKLGTDNGDYALDLNNLAALYQDMGSYEQAEILYKEAIRFEKEKTGEDYTAYAGDLNNLAQLYLNMGRYEQAEVLCKEALRIIKEKLGEDNSDYALKLISLSSIYYEMGRYEQAEPLMKEAIRIFKNQLGVSHPDYAIVLNNLAQLYEAEGRYELAEPLFKETLGIDREKLGNEHPSCALDLSNLGLLYVAMRRYDQAEPLFLEALRIVKEKLGEDHPLKAKYLNNLAELYMDKGWYQKAEPLYQEALQINKEKLGENHPYYALDLNKLAKLYQEMGRYDKAEPLMIEAYKIFQFQLKNNTGFLSEKELEEFLNTFSSNLEIYQSFNISRSGRNSTGRSGVFAFNIELNRKGILLKAAQQLRSRILESGDTSLVNTFNKLLSLNKQIAKLYSTAPEKRPDDPVELEQQANELEKILTLKSKDYRQGKEEASITWREVQQQLKPGEAIVEFSSFSFYGKRRTDSIYYCALVLRPEDVFPRMIFLFEERSLAGLLKNTSQDMHQLYASDRGAVVVNIPGDLSYRSPSLYQLIIKPIDTLLTGVKTIYYVPAGLLNRISFPAIAVNAKKRLADKFNLVCLSSSKTLVTKKQNEQLFTGSNNTIALFGGINYEWNTNQPQKLQQTDKGELLAMRSAWLPEDKVRNSTFSYLPGTLEEVKSIDEQCHKHQAKDQIYTADMATEAQFKSLSGKNSPAIIHLSTHGFFINDPSAGSGNHQTIYTNKQKYVYSRDPLLRSGLAFAGANRAWSGQEIPEGMDNGILQAKEVSNMDLRNTKLVVLSACETGLGDVKGSEGVYGLQRSFKMAGAEYLLMSLWPVPDEATQKLMTIFYENLFNRQPITEAFKNAQNKLRHMKKEYKDPYYWAAWVLAE